MVQFSHLLRRAAAVAVLAGCSGALVLSALPASAAPHASAAAMTATVSRVGLPPQFESWQAFFAAQRLLDDAADRVEAAADATASSGFAADRVDTATGTLTLYWKGAPTKVEELAIERARRTVRHLVVKPAVYSKVQLDAASALIEKDAGGVAGLKVSYIAVHPDGSGITVGVARTGTTQASAAGAPYSSAELGRALPYLRQAEAFVSVTVLADNRAAGSVTVYSREYDLPPYRGGSVILRALGGGRSFSCSSGFAVHWPYDNKDYMTTAAHCGGVGATWYNGEAQEMGVGTPGLPHYDLEFIRTRTAGSVYGGSPLFRSGQTRLNVVRAAHTHHGDHVCTDGAFTGQVCTLSASGGVKECDNPKVPGGCYYVEGAISSVQGLPVTGVGDSGGPVFALDLGGVEARGIISGPPLLPDGSEDPAFPEIRCADPLTGGYRDCSTAVWYTDILSAIAPWKGMYVKTRSH